MYLKFSLKYESFDEAIGIKIPFFRVLVTIGRSLLQLVTTNCLIYTNIFAITSFCSLRALMSFHTEVYINFSLPENLQFVQV